MCVVALVERGTWQCTIVFEGRLLYVGAWHHDGYLVIVLYLVVSFLFDLNFFQ